jgi:hypothetical protein
VSAPAPRRKHGWSASRVIAVIVPPLALVIASSSGAFACRGSWVQGPKVIDHPPGAGEGVCVPFPPPAPKVEEIPPRPTDDHVFIDGQWSWQTRRWVWVAGGWVVPPPGASYAKWKIERLNNGAIAYYQGHWHERSPSPYDANASIVCPAPPKPGAFLVVNADAADEVEAHVGPVIVYPADAPSSAPPKIVLDATLPSDAVPQNDDVAPKLIAPPD